MNQSEFGDSPADVNEFGDVAVAEAPPLDPTKIEGLFAGPDGFSKVLDHGTLNQLNQALAGQGDPKAGRMRVANQVMLSQHFGLPLEKIVAAPQQYRDSYAKQVLGEEQGGDDATFYGKVGAHLSKAKEERGMLQEMAVGIFNAVRSGNDFNSTFASEASQRRATPTWDAKRQDLYRQFARQQWDKFSHQKEALESTSSVVAEYLTAAKQRPDPESADENFSTLQAQKEKAIGALSKLAPDDAEMAMDFAAFTAKQSEGPDRGFDEKVAGRMTRGADNLVKGVIGTVKEGFRGQANRDAANYPSVGLFQERSAEANDSRKRDQLGRKLEQRLTGEVDLMKANGWIANGILASAESVPYMTAAMTLPGSAVTLLANKENIRGRFEDAGMTPANADLYSWVAAAPYTAIDHVQSRMLFQGKLPGLERFLTAPVADLAGLAKRAAFVAGAQTVEQVGQQTVQNLVPPVVQSLASALSESNPKVDWRKEFKAIGETTPETIAALLPFVLVGTATASFKDRAYGREYLRQEKALRAVGFKEETIQEIQKADTPEAASQVIRENWNDRNIGSEAQKQSRLDLNKDSIRIREEMGQTFSPEQKALFEKYPEFNSLPPNQYPVEVQRPDGTIYPAAFNGYYDFGPEKVYASAAKFTPEGWSHGAIPPTEKILTPVPSPEQWAAGIRQAEPPLKPLPAEATVEYLGRSHLVMEGVGEPVDQWQVTLPGDEGRGLTVSAEELKGMGLQAPPLPEGVAPMKEKAPAADVGLMVRKNDSGEYVVSDSTGKVLGTATSSETASQIVRDARDRPPVSEPEPNTTALNKEEIARVRDLFDLPELPTPERVTMEETLSQAKEEGMVKNAEVLAEHLIDHPREITAKEHASMVLRSAELQNQYEELSNQAALQMDMGNVHKGEELRQTAESVLGQLDRLTEASDLAGTQIGRALSIRRMRVNRTTYELASIVQRAKLAKRGTLTPEQTEQFRQLSVSLKEQQSKIDSLENELAQERQKQLAASAETFVSEGRATRARANKGANLIKRAQLKKELQELGYRVNDITGTVGQGAKVSYIVAQLAKTYIEDGANSLHEVSGKLKEDIPDLTDQDIFNALGGRIKGEAKRIKSEAQQRVVELQKQARLFAKISDALDKHFDSKEVPKDSEAVKNLREIMGKLRLQADRVVRDDKSLTAIHEKIAKVQDQLSGGFRTIPEKEQQTRANEKLDAARKTLEELRTEMGLTDQVASLEEMLRTGESPAKDAKPEDPNAKLSALREKVEELRKAIDKRDNPPAPEKTGEEVNAERETRLKEKLTQLEEQMAGGFRLIPEKSDAIPDEVKVSALRKQVRELESLMRTEDQIADLEEQIRTGDYNVSEPERRIIQSAKLQDALVKRKQLQREINDRIEAMKPKTAFSRAIDVLTLPRSVMATADMSATFRQGLFLSTRRPITAVKAFGQSWKAFFSQNSADAIDLAIKMHPNQLERVRAGLYLSELDVAPNRKEEQFVSNLAAKIPGFGAIVRGSERSMATTLNLLRSSAFDQFISSHPDTTIEQRKAFAAYVNVASGRGDLGSFNRATKELNSVFFAPRYAVSRFQLLYSPFKNIKDPVVRMEIAKDFAAFAGTGLAVLTIASLAGAKVGTDPESPDFGKIVMGHTHIDIWGGLQQPVRLIMQPILAGLDKTHLRETEKKIDPLEAGRRFLTYKLAPSVTIPAALLTGKDVVGNPQEPSETLLRSIVPLLGQDVFEVYKDTDDAATAAAVGALSFVGVGVNQQPPRKKKR
jgi:hypothetical protein